MVRIVSCFVLTYVHSFSVRIFLLHFAAIRGWRLQFSGKWLSPAPPNPSLHLAFSNLSQLSSDPAAHSNGYSTSVLSPPHSFPYVPSSTCVVPLLLTELPKLLRHAIFSPLALWVASYSQMYATQLCLLV